jgi:hypothetical protein
MATLGDELRLLSQCDMVNSAQLSPTWIGFGGETGIDSLSDRMML